MNLFRTYNINRLLGDKSSQEKRLLTIVDQHQLDIFESVQSEKCSKNNWAQFYAISSFVQIVLPCLEHHKIVQRSRNVVVHFTPDIVVRGKDC